MVADKDSYLLYKGKPLVRKDNVICYGNLSDENILMMTILTEKEIDLPNGKKEKVPDLILTQVMGKDSGQEGHPKIMKQFTKNGLYESLDIGIVTLERL